MAKSGFYTNRLRFAEMIDLFRVAGFSVETRAVSKWCVFRTNVTARFGIVTADFGSVTGRSGDVTGGAFALA